MRLHSPCPADFTTTAPSGTSAEERDNEIQRQNHIETIFMITLPSVVGLTCAAAEKAHTNGNVKIRAIKLDSSKRIYNNGKFR